MKTILKNTAVLLTIGLISCSTTSPTRQVTLESFSLAIPKTVELTKQRSEKDYTLYSCTAAGVPILRFEVENVSPVPKDNATTAGISKTLIDGIKVKDNSLSKGNLHSREVRVELAGQASPKFVHFWYNDLSLTNSGVADGIIDSLRQTK